jgi:NDP-sugar pyrophosphorylase family protein
MNKSMLPVVILAGGLATRLRPFTEKTPKSLFEINGEPFIAHQLRLLRKNNIRKVVICAGFLGEKIYDFIQDGSRFELQVTYVYDGVQLLGTGGAIKQALPHLEEAFFVLNGDSYLPCNFQAIQAVFKESQKMALMTIFQNDDLWDVSNVEFRNGILEAYDKKNRTKKMCHIDYGLGILTQQAFKYVPQNCFYDLADLYQTLLHQKQLAAYEVNRRFYEIGSFAGINEFSDYLKDSLYE